MSESEWESFEDQPWNPPGADVSADDFEKEYDEADSGLVALLETFGTNDEDFFHESAVPDGTRAVSFEVAHRSKLKTPCLNPAIMAFLPRTP